MRPAKQQQSDKSGVATEIGRWQQWGRLQLGAAVGALTRCAKSMNRGRQACKARAVFSNGESQRGSKVNQFNLVNCKGKARLSKVSTVQAQQCGHSEAVSGQQPGVGAMSEQQPAMREVAIIGGIQKTMFVWEGTEVAKDLHMDAVT
eukprot:366574-Chlamydomonas_euryale.AAC.6